MFLVIASVEAKEGESEVLLEKLKHYISIVLDREPGTRYFEVYTDALKGLDDERYFKILEGYDDEAAYENHQNMPYRMAYIEDIRENLVTGSAQQFTSQN